MIAWHEQARRMHASGAYPSKASIARELGVSVGHIYEVLDPSLGERTKRQRLARQKEQYHTDAEYRAKKIGDYILYEPRTKCCVWCVKLT